MPTRSDNEDTRLDNAATELAGSADGDTNEYVMRRWDELEQGLRIKKLQAELDGMTPFEIHSLGET